MSLPIAPINMDPKNYERLDAPLIALTNACGGDLRHLLFAFFSFLHRRTDFYLVPPDEGGPHKMGFKEGDAEKVLLAAFRQFPLRKIPAGAKAKATTQDSKVGSPSAVAEKGSDKPATTKAALAQKKKNTEEESKVNEDSISEKGSVEANKSESKDRIEKAVSKAPESAQKCETEEGAIQRTPEGLQIPVGNGGTTEKYSWTQTLDEVTVVVKTPMGTSGKDLDVSMKPSKLSVKDKKGNEYLDGVLVESIRADESTWSLESGGGVLVITLDKHEKKYWDTVLQGDDRIDTSLVDSRRHISDYDDVTQATIRRIMFEQSEKRKKEEAGKES